MEIKMILLVLLVAQTQAQLVGVWTATNPMTKAREVHTSTLLQNGLVLVAGGFTDAYNVDIFQYILYNSSELFNSSTGAWTATGSMTNARSFHTATLLASGLVLVAGGDENTPSTSELFNPSTNRWTATTDPMTTSRSSHTATLLPSGLVLVAGGQNTQALLSSAELFNPSTGQWTLTGSMTAIRFTHTATLLPNGLVLVAGGLNSDVLSSAELFNPSTGHWTATNPMTTPRTSHTATLLLDGLVLVAGGSPDEARSLSGTELFNPTTSLWTAAQNMTSSRLVHTATLLQNGSVLVAGGVHSNLGTNSALSSCELFNPTTGQWTVTGSMTMTRQDHAASLLQNGLVLVTGGTNVDDNQDFAVSNSEIFAFINSTSIPTSTQTPFFVPQSFNWTYLTPNLTNFLYSQVWNQYSGDIKTTITSNDEALLNSTLTFGQNRKMSSFYWSTSSATGGVVLHAYSASTSIFYDDPYEYGFQQTNNMYFSFSLQSRTWTASPILNPYSYADLSSWSSSCVKPTGEVYILGGGSGNSWMLLAQPQNYANISSIYEPQNEGIYSCSTSQFNPANLPNPSSFLSLSPVCSTDGSKFWLLDMESTGDLFTYSSELNQFACLPTSSASSLSNLGSYGTVGVESASNSPPIRLNGAFWTEGNYVYMYGGFLGASSTQCNDFWRLNINNGYWTWLGCGQLDPSTGTCKSANTFSGALGSTCPPAYAIPYNAVSNPSQSSVVLFGCGNKTCESYASQNNPPIDNLDNEGYFSNQKYITVWIWQPAWNGSIDGTWSTLSNSLWTQGRGPFPGASVPAWFLSNNTNTSAIICTVDTSRGIWCLEEQLDSFKVAILAFTVANGAVGALGLFMFVLLMPCHRKTDRKRWWFFLVTALAIGDNVFSGVSFMIMDFGSTLIRNCMFAFVWICPGILALVFASAAGFFAVTYTGIFTSSGLLKILQFLHVPTSLFQSHSHLHEFLIEGVYLFVVFIICFAIVLVFVSVAGVFAISVGIFLGAVSASRIIQAFLMARSLRDTRRYSSIVGPFFAILHSIPMLIIQSYNASITGALTGVTVASIVLSAYMILDTIYSSLYFCSHPYAEGGEKEEKDFEMDSYDY